MSISLWIHVVHSLNLKSRYTVVDNPQVDNVVNLKMFEGLVLYLAFVSIAITYIHCIFAIFGCLMVVLSNR